MTQPLKQKLRFLFYNFHENYLYDISWSFAEEYQCENSIWIGVL